MPIFVARVSKPGTVSRRVTDSSRKPLRLISLAIVDGKVAALGEKRKAWRARLLQCSLSRWSSGVWRPCKTHIRTQERQLSQLLYRCSNLFLFSVGSPKNLVNLGLRHSTILQHGAYLRFSAVLCRLNIA